MSTNMYCEFFFQMFFIGNSGIKPTDLLPNWDSNIAKNINIYSKKLILWATTVC